MQVEQLIDDFEEVFRAAGNAVKRCTQHDGEFTFPSIRHHGIEAGMLRLSAVPLTRDRIERPLKPLVNFLSRSSRRVPSARVYRFMAVGTERDQIVAGIISEPATGADVMDFELGRAATVLAPPSIPLKDLPPKMVVGICFQPQARPLLS